MVAVFLPVVWCGGSVTSRRLMPISHPEPFLIPSAANSFDDSLFSCYVPFSPCHSCMAGHLPPGSMNSLGPILPLPAALRGDILDPTSLPRFSDQHCRGVLSSDLLMLLCGLHHFWIRHSLLCISLRCILAHLPISWSSEWSLSIWLSHRYPICIPLLPHSCYMPRPSHPS
jgi:hypothetical protein